MNRRQFAAASLAAAAVAAGSRSLVAAQAARPKRKFCAFIKFVQSLKYDELAERIAALGFDGVEATVRQGGYIDPADAPAELPKLHAALKKQGLEITIVTSDIVRADQPHAEHLLQAAAELGIPRYRLGFMQYDLEKPVLEQLAALPPVFDALAALNRRVGIAALYQNHSGAKMVGATIWDLHYLIKNYPVAEVGCVYDIRHATVEAGEAWPTLYQLMKPHIGALSVKDFRWKGRRAANAPLGEGQVDPAFFEKLDPKFAGPLSVHVEYLEDEDVEANLAALGRDLATLRKWLGAA
jgi:sugar phosphate isomerase/epimerase